MLYLEMHSFTSCHLKGKRKNQLTHILLQDENVNSYCFECFVKCNYILFMYALSQKEGKPNLVHDSLPTCKSMGGGGGHFFTKQQFLLPFVYRKLNYHPQYSFETIPLVTRCEITFVTIMKVPYNLVLCCKRDNFYKLDSKIIKNTKIVLKNFKNSFLLCFGFIFISFSFFIFHSAF